MVDRRLKYKKIYIPLIAGTLLIGAGLLIHWHFFGTKDITEKIDTEKIIPLDAYGIQYQNYIVESGEVRSGQTLSVLLNEFAMAEGITRRVIDTMGDLFDVRQFRAGNSFHAYKNRDSLNTLRYFVYDISRIEYIKVDITDSIIVTRNQKEVTTVSKTASGILNSSLWETIERNNLNPELAIEMSEILAWEIDFYRLHSGDRFRVVYDEQYVGNEGIGIGDVFAIYFQHQGREIYGFRFVKDTIDGYFNKEGDNLRKKFLRSPISFGRISSRFSHSRLHPVLGVRRPHHGTDYAAPVGTPIYALGDGVVTRANFNSGNGNYVRIRHNSVYETQYLHMSRFAKGIRPGVRVKQGDVIGYVGMTGLATGPHVCLRFTRNGHPINHLKEEFPSASPLPEVFHDEFFIIRDKYLKVLENIEFKETSAAD